MPPSANPSQLTAPAIFFCAHRYASTAWVVVGADGRRIAPPSCRYCGTTPPSAKPSQLSPSLIFLTDHR